MNNLVSIIVPIYNVSDYIERCLMSLKNQTYPYIEVLLIDDGSTDNSGEIAKSFTTTDARFKYFYKANGGLSSARNYGIERARGDFLCFIDSDDFIAKYYVEHLLDNLVGDIDFVSCDYAIYDYLEKRFYYRPNYHKFGSIIYSNNDVIKDVIYNDSLFISACMGLYKKSIIIENQLRFVSERIVYSEDQLFNLNYLLFCKKITKIDQILYFHLVIDTSLTQSYREGIFEMNMTRYHKIMDTLNAYGLNNIANDYALYLPHLVIDSIIMMSRCNFLKATSNIRFINNNSTAIYSKKFNDIKWRNKRFKLIYIMNKYLPCFALALLLKIALWQKQYLNVVCQKKLEYIPLNSN